VDGEDPDETGGTFRDYREVIDGRGLRPAETVKMLQTVTSLQPTFICFDAQDQYVEGHQPVILDSLQQIIERSPNTRIVLTGRSAPG